ncbi:MAG: hypothetical protein ACREE6_06805, partial [Limisphaerales bacterium]
HKNFAKIKYNDWNHIILSAGLRFTGGFFDRSLTSVAPILPRLPRDDGATPSVPLFFGPVKRGVT